ncbi:hypothetical protein D3C72_1877890 [compost metagenome]
MLAFFIPAELRHAAPVVRIGNGKSVIQATGEGEGCREKLADRRVVSTQKRIQRALTVAGGAICR